MRHTPQWIHQSTWGVCLIFALNLVAPAAIAGGFSLYTESSVSELSVFAAGAAAEAPDESIGWYNPAGLVLMAEDGIVFSGVGVMPSMSITGTSTFDTDGVPPYIQSFNDMNGGRNAVVPALHLAHPLGERAALGFSLVSPFGLSTHWPSDSPLRYAGTLTEILTVVASPEIAGYLTDNLSIGMGLDLEWARVTFDAVAGSPAELQFLESQGGLVTPTMLDSLSENVGHSFGVGFHAGLLAFFNDARTRIGFNFQSSVEHQFEGRSTLTGLLADPELTTNPDAVYRLDTLRSNPVRLPNITTLSFYQEMTSHWTMLGSVVYTGWRVFKTTELSNVAGADPDTGEQIPITIIADQYYRDTWRFALGSRYDLNEQWTFRLGGGFDQTPTQMAYRDGRLPDINRFALSGGLHYQPRPSIGFDIGYLYLWGAGQTPVHKTQIINEKSRLKLDAWGRNHANLAGFQAVWRPLD